MSTCDGCKFADWKKTSNGRLHPSKEGKCSRLIAYPPDLRLPVAFTWFGGQAAITGGNITRGEEHRDWNKVADKWVAIRCIFKAGL